MKLLSVVMVIFLIIGGAAVCYGNLNHLVPKNNSHYVEGESRYIWMNDDAGVLQQVDLQEPVDETLLYARYGTNNRYFLYTRGNPTNPRLITYNNVGSINSAGYRLKLPLVVLVHGWVGNLSSPMNPKITAALLDSSDVNVIVVDWEAVADLSYPNAVHAVPSVGQFLGNFLVWLINNSGTNWNNVHLVGHSLGAHVVGNAGRTAENRPARITGLDPAGPLWRTSNGNRLRPSDGVYVEVIHTDGGLQGILDAIGDADFYPNGGRSQAGCSHSQCNHERAYYLFAATVRHNHLVGRQCSNLSQAQSNECNGNSLNMGNNQMNKRGNGIYGLRTGANWPF